jgi:aminopeptidase-like protein
MKDERYLLRTVVPEDIGEEIFAFVAEIYPFCRSITDRGVRETLRAIGAHSNLEAHEVPTGTSVYDWVIPREWNIRNAYIKNETGERSSTSLGQICTS